MVSRPKKQLKTDVDKLDYANLKESDFKSKEELQNSPNIEYWKNYKISTIQKIYLMLKQRCGNCAAFNITDKNERLY